MTYFDGSKLPYLGKEYVLNVEVKDVQAFSLKNGKFIVKVAETNPNKIKNLYEKWLEKQS